MSDDINDPIAALRDELSRVSVSPDFAARVGERLADDLEPLRAELADLTPSPEFAVRVRQSIEQRGPGGFSWSRLNWRWLVPVSVLAAAAMIAMMLLRPAEVPAPPPNIAKMILPPPSSGEQVPTPPAQVRPRAVQPVARATSAAQADRSRMPRDPMLEVITDQPKLLRNLSVSVAPGIAVDPTEPAETYQAPKLEVAPIEVSPIVTFLVPDLRVPVGATPIILRMPADQAERSSR
jgi:hypothetical protein